MSETPQFRTVLRGADPQQVATAMSELHASLVAVRRALAERTTELSRVQAEHQALEATLATAQRRIAEMDRQRPVAPTGHGDVGPLISSMLKLAEEEAAQIRATALSEMAQERERVAQATAAETRAQQSHLDQLRVRAARLSDELGETRAQAEAENERRLAEAQEAAERIRHEANQEGGRITTAAQVAADAIVEGAVREAQRMRDDSHALRNQAESIRARAAEESQQQLAGAQQEAERLLEEAEAAAVRLQDAARLGVADAVAERDRILAYIQEILALLETLDEILQDKDPAVVA
jgi:cell division septum initiation protein DivIVA